MGMAASQARYLSLTNMLNDVEFEGQQINTARTQLSSTSAKYYNQLLTMDVPTPPVKTDYTTLNYSYNYQGKDYSITHIGNVDADGNAEITTQYTGYGATVQPTANKTAVKVTFKDVDTVDADGNPTKERKYYIDGKEPQGLDSVTDATEKARLEKAIKQTGQNPDDYYVVPDGTGYKLVLKTDVQDNSDGALLHEVNDTEDAIYEEVKNVKLEFGNDGRISAVYESGYPILVTPTLTVDELAYEDAFAQYTYDKAIYDKDQATINAQLSTIQQQDKRLELQLTELDTRRTQITTELEAVKGVLNDNIDRTYKTFSG